MRKKLKIAMLTAFYFPHLGGTERYVDDLSQALAERGHDITIFTAYPGPKGAYDRSGVTVVRVPSLWVPYAPYAALFPTKKLRAFDIIHSHAPSFFFANQATRLRGIPHVLTYHNDVYLADQFGFFKLPPPSKRMIEKYFHKSAQLSLRKIDAIVATTRSYAESSSVLKNQRYQVIPIGVHLGEFEKAFQRLHLESVRRNPQEVLYVGRLVASKGLVYLIQGAKILKDRRVPFLLTIVGSGEDSLLLKLLVKNLDLEEQVRFMGPVDQETLYRRYAEASVFVLPSIVRLEAFGIVQLEALAMGLPVVVSDLPGVNELVQHSGGGWIVPPRDPEALAQTLAYALNHPEERAQRALQGKEYVRIHNDWRRIAQRFEDLYFGLLEAQSPATSTLS